MSQIKNIINKNSKAQTNKIEDLVSVLLKKKNDEKMDLSRIPDHLWLDTEFCKEMMRFDHKSLKYIPEDIFKNNMNKISYDVSRIKIHDIQKWMPEELIKYIYSNKECMLELVYKSPSVIEFASEELKKDKEVITSAIRNFYKEDITKIVPYEYLKDEIFLLSLIKENTNLLFNETIMSNISSETIINNWNDFSEEEKIKFFEKLEKTTIDEKIILDFSRLKWTNMFVEFPELQSRNFSENFIKDYAVGKYADLPEKYKENISLAKELLTNGEHIWEDMPQSLKQNKEMVLLAMNNERIWGDLSIEQKRDFEIGLFGVYRYGLLSEKEEYHPDLWENEVFSIALVSRKEGNYNILSDNQKKNVNVVSALLKRSFMHYSMIEQNIKTDVEFNRKLIKTGALKGYYSVLEKDIYYNKNIVIEILKKDLSEINGYLDIGRKENLQKIYKDKSIIKALESFVNAAREKKILDNKNEKNYLKYALQYREEDLRTRLKTEVVKNELEHRKKKI